MSFIALVGPEIEENLSLRYLASALMADGWRVEIVPFASACQLGDALDAVLLADEPPVMVGLSLAFQWRAHDVLAYAMALRERGYAGHVTAGGHFATFACKELLAEYPELDTIVRQEAEETLPALVRAVVDGAPLEPIPGLAYRDEGRVRLTAMPAVPDLATIRWPDRRGPPAACFDHAIAPLVSSRGCYANCSFCCIAAWHEQTLPGKRYRQRPVEDVADEMVALWRDRGVEIFVFHDDNFFVPSKRLNAERFEALADALEARGIGRYATVVKARPTDVDERVFGILRDRLNCIRCYVGVETDADQGLVTLRRWARPRQNREAIRIVRDLDLYVCFNLLMFDPDTTLEDLETNLAFIEHASEFPSNFGRVELYAGTPLLHRMQQEGRATGDFLQWDYLLATADVQRVWELAMGAFHERNFSPGALANRIMGTRFDLEVARHFHPDVFDPAWLGEGKASTSELALDSVAGLRRIVEHVRTHADVGGDEALVRELAADLRQAEATIGAACSDLAARVLRAVGRGAPLTDIGDRVATPLQRGIHLGVT
ncbi:MAG: B12-binding domain-containing radical SAM protein [Myxococcales bacterium]|nr:B12-binding domain-containing radical SAM protein [Myxococcales bacterium]